MRFQFQFVIITRGAGWEYARAASGMGEASLAACAALAALLAAAAAVLGLDALVQLSVRAPAPHAHAA